MYCVVKETISQKTGYKMNSTDHRTIKSAIAQFGKIEEEMKQKGYIFENDMTSFTAEDAKNGEYENRGANKKGDTVVLYIE